MVYDVGYTTLTLSPIHQLSVIHVKVLASSVYFLLLLFSFYVESLSLTQKKEAPQGSVRPKGVKTQCVNSNFQFLLSFDSSVLKLDNVLLNKVR